MAGVTTPAQVGNLALGFVGVRKYISALTENSVEAQAVQLHFPVARDVALESHWWKFATKRSTLARLTTTITGWAYCYAAPSDWVSSNGARYLEPGVQSPTIDQLPPFAVELDAAGGQFLIATDEEAPELVYTRKLNDSVALWPAHFQAAVAWHLAMSLALVLPVKPDVASRLEPKARLALEQAVAVDLRVGTPALRQDAEHVRVR